MVRSVMSWKKCTFYIHRFFRVFEILSISCCRPETKYIFYDNIMKIDSLDAEKSFFFFFFVHKPTNYYILSNFSVTTAEQKSNNTFINNFNSIFAKTLFFKMIFIVCYFYSRVRDHLNIVFIVRHFVIKIL